MSMDSNQLIAALSADLKPVRRPLPGGVTALLWLLVSTAFVIGVTHWQGPIRATAMQQLAGEPRFAVETILGALAIAWTAVVGFRSAIPGAKVMYGAAIAIALLALWLGNYLFGLVDPALAPSMLGKREHCYAEALLFALPPVGLALLLTRRLYPLQPAYSACLLGLAAGMIPALYMQIACMYVPLHILQMHILPGLLVMPVAVLCTLVAVRLRRRNPLRIAAK